MRGSFVAAAFALALLGAPQVMACEPTTTEPSVCLSRAPPLCVSTAIAGLIYVVHYDCGPDCFDPIFIYRESNGIPGLQERDEVKDDTCDGQIEGDTIVF